MKLLVLALAIGVVVVAMPAGARADGSWLDEQPLPSWNEPRMDVPAPPSPAEGEIVNPDCVSQQRPPETDEDQQVVLAGWYLVGGYDAGWGIKVITGASSFDGMCLPLGYQEFVFADGLFAGTISPAPMDSRTDGAAARAQITDADRLAVQFSRYAGTDPLCCPSRVTFATYRIDRTSGAPVLVIESASTQPTS